MRIANAIGGRLAAAGVVGLCCLGTPAHAGFDVSDVENCTAPFGTLHGRDLPLANNLIVVHYNSDVITSEADLLPGGIGYPDPTPYIAFIEVRHAQFASLGFIPDPQNYAFNAILPSAAANGTNLPPDLMAIDQNIFPDGQPGFDAQAASWTIDYYDDDAGTSPGTLTGSRFHTVLFGNVLDYQQSLIAENIDGHWTQQLSESVLAFNDGLFHSVQEAEIDLETATVASTGRPYPGLQPVRSILFGVFDLTELGHSTDPGLFSGSSDAVVTLWGTSACTVDTISYVVHDRLGLSVTSPLWINSIDSPLIDVELGMGCLSTDVAGYQAWTLVDGPATLVPGSGSYTAVPFGLHIFEPITQVGTDVDIAAGINQFDGQTPTDDDASLATVQFDATGAAGGDTIAFRFDLNNLPPSRFTLPGGATLDPYLADSYVVTVDNDPPIMACPGNEIVDPDVGSCTAIVPITAPAATDTQDPDPIVIGVRSDGMPLDAPFSSGITTITWTAVDLACNETICEQLIEVTPFNTLEIAVELAGVWADSGPLSLQRCITLGLFECGGDMQSVDVLLDFESPANGVAARAEAVVEIPCGAWDCVTARDRRHTLRRRDDDDFTIVGDVFVCDFTATTGFSDDDSLIGGNVNDDAVIDILDYGPWLLANGTDYGTGDTNCITASPHLDFSGDGLVDIADQSFIQIGFGTMREANCCGLARLLSEDGPRRGDDRRVRTRISLRELRARGLTWQAADLNSDGWVDLTDVAIAVQGGTP